MYSALVSFCDELLIRGHVFAVVLLNVVLFNTQKTCDGPAGHVSRADSTGLTLRISFESKFNCVLDEGSDHKGAKVFKHGYAAHHSCALKRAFI